MEDMIVTLKHVTRKLGRKRASEQHFPGVKEVQVLVRAKDMDDAVRKVKAIFGGDCGNWEVTGIIPGEA